MLACQAHKAGGEEGTTPAISFTLSPYEPCLISSYGGIHTAEGLRQPQLAELCSSSPTAAHTAQKPGHLLPSVTWVRRTVCCAQNLSFETFTCRVLSSSSRPPERPSLRALHTHPTDLHVTCASVCSARPQPGRQHAPSPGRRRWRQMARFHQRPVRLGQPGGERGTASSRSVSLCWALKYRIHQRNQVRDTPCSVAPRMNNDF